MCPLLPANSLSGRGFPRKDHLLHVMKSSLLKVKLFSDQPPYPEVTLQNTAQAVGCLAAPDNTQKFGVSADKNPLAAAGRPSPGPAPCHNVHRELEGAPSKSCASLTARMTFLDLEPDTKNKTCPEFVVDLNEYVGDFQGRMRKMGNILHHPRVPLVRVSPC